MGSTHPLRPAQLLAALADHGVEFVVIGGFALAPHGYVRATKDIDIVPSPEPANLKRLATALRGLDADTAGFRDGGNWVLLTRYGRLDVMQDVPGLRDYGHLRRGALEVDGVLYAGYDELISMKAASGRDEDLRDIGALEAARRS